MNAILDLNLYRIVTTLPRQPEVVSAMDDRGKLLPWRRICYAGSDMLSLLSECWGVLGGFCGPSDCLTIRSRIVLVPRFFLRTLYWLLVRSVASPFRSHFCSMPRHGFLWRKPIRVIFSVQTVLNRNSGFDDLRPSLAILFRVCISFEHPHLARFCEMFIQDRSSTHKSSTHKSRTHKSRTHCVIQSKNSRRQS